MCPIVNRIPNPTLLGKRKTWAVGGNLVVSIPRDMTRHFKLEPGNEVDTYFEGGKLIFDLATANKPASWKQEAEAQEQEAAPAV
jgi:hypothetical protein